MIVVGGADVDGKAYADGETGYGKGMYYGQPSGMMWPGMDGKIHSDADVNALTDGTKIIFGDDSDKDGSYPYGTFKATGDAKASGDAEAYAPFDVHGDFKGGEYSGKDGKQGMIVVGGADVDGKAYADGETGYGKGMYYGQPSGMMWPGMDGKIHSDADVNALTDGTKIIFGDDSDKDGSYPYGTFKATGDLNAISKSSSDNSLELASKYGGPSENPHCLDESGSSRVYGETWYKNGDACMLCSCHSYGNSLCERKVCESHPNPPSGHKVVAHQSDDCCMSYTIVSDTCSLDSCSNKPPVCEYYEDLQIIPEDKCCSSFACVCNPHKCITFDNDFICPSGQTKELVSSVGCCQIPKCTSVTGLQGTDGKSMATANILQSSAILMSFDDANKLSKTNDVSYNADTGAHALANSLTSGDYNANGLINKFDSSGDKHSITEIVLGGTSATGQSYASYAKGRHEDLTAGFTSQFIYTGKTTCEFVTDSSFCPETCPENMVCDGKSCVYPKDCPCFSNSIRRQTGSVWKENNGCETCTCIGGKVSCVPEVCDITSCKSGEKLVINSDACCGTCVTDADRCEDKFGVHSLWETWTDSCNKCTCTDKGTVCVSEKCDIVEKPTCLDNEMLITRKHGCCDSYECMCDPSLCKTSKPECEVNHEPVVINSDECCPQYNCVCRSETCQKPPVCNTNEESVRVNSQTECCGKYQCKPIGCTDESGILREPETTWQMKNDTCQTCSCMNDLTVMCKSRDCPVLKKPLCEDGREPSIIYDIDGCCPSYICSFTCEGHAGSSQITTFDGQRFSKFCPCTHVLAKDTYGLDFEISVSREQCMGGICTKFITFTDKSNKQTVVINKDATNEFDGFSMFDIVNEDQTVNVIQKSTGVKLTFNLIVDSWIIDVPAKFAGKTEGLCGMADGEANNDFSVGGNPTDLSDFFKYWALNPLCVDIHAQASAASLAKCTKYFEKMPTESSASAIDNSEFIDACSRYIWPKGNNVPLSWPGCSVFSAFANKAAKSGTCTNWRSEKFCSYTNKCRFGTTFSACGPNVPKTCENYKTYSTLNVAYDTEGCYCDAEKVLSNGKCIEISKCPVCKDETGKGRFVGEQWKCSGEPCIVSMCSPDGTVTQTQAQCENKPVCNHRETLAKVASDNECCNAYVCLPNDQAEKCSDVNCPTADKPVCKIGEVMRIKATSKDQCCFTYECECNSETCPTYNVPTCEEGEELEVIDNDSCCPSATCVCKHETCTQAPICNDEGHKLVIVGKSRCCPQYDCVCDRETCKNSVPQCASGEFLQVDSTSACCPTYKCVCDSSRCPSSVFGVQKCSSGFKRVVTSSSNDCCPTYECQCDITQCPASRTPVCPTDKPGYKLIDTGINKPRVGGSECCPNERNLKCLCDIDSCEHDDTVCRNFERKIQTNVGECCPQYTCECDTNKCNSGVLSCPSGKHIVEKQINDCCKSRVCECDICPEIKTCQEGWLTVESELSDECGCKTVECKPPASCISNGEKYQPDTVWMDDICTECTCKKTGVGYYEPKCTPIKCGTCSAGYTYVPVAGQCCGDCVPTVCHYEGKQYAPGQTWTNPENECTKCECMIDPLTNEVYSQCLAPTCPPIDENCSTEDIFTTEDGCCTYCKPRATATGCRPVIDFVEQFEQDGCVSVGKVNVTMCEGQCTSSSVFSMDKGSFQKQCSCCSAVETEEKSVDLVCPDGSIKKYKYQVATQCKCGATTCGAGLPQN